MAPATTHSISCLRSPSGTGRPGPTATTSIRSRRSPPQPPRCVHGKKLVVVEGVYSMDGDVCVLPEIVDVAKRHGARILIDEAHSTFLFGANGRGVAEHFGLEDEVDFHLGTFSKSLGGQGGFVAGSMELVDYVRGLGRSRLFP